MASSVDGAVGGSCPWDQVYQIVQGELTVLEAASSRQDSSSDVESMQIVYERVKSMTVGHVNDGDGRTLQTLNKAEAALESVAPLSAWAGRWAAPQSTVEDFGTCGPCVEVQHMGGWEAFEREKQALDEEAESMLERHLAAQLSLVECKRECERCGRNYTALLCMQYIMQACHQRSLRNLSATGPDYASRAQSGGGAASGESGKVVSALELGNTSDDHSCPSLP
mmetsp:Transcript_85363/g.198481  ORF Transcript_85363/g.198481 Transcript_85363/m.198481 type:complete len:224 (-) Transcript_85363:173-844(-)